MLGQRHRRWPNIKSALVQSVMSKNEPTSTTIRHTVIRQISLSLNFLTHHSQNLVFLKSYYSEGSTNKNMLCKLGGGSVPLSLRLVTDVSQTMWWVSPFKFEACY